MDKKTRNIALMIIVIAGIIGFGYIFVNYGFKPSINDAPEISKKSIEKILLDGKVVSEKSADLGFIIPAKIKFIAKNVGDTVRAGEILATQESVDLQAQVDATQAAQAGAQTGLSKSNHDLKREKLKLHGLSGNERRQQQAQISSSEDSVEIQKNTILSAQDSVINAKAQLEKTILRAPFDGIITRQDGEVGEVGGSSAPSFLTISSNEPLRKIEAFASDLDVANTKIGQSAQITFDVLGTQRTLTAKVDAIDPAATNIQGKSAYKVTLILDATDAEIKSGMHASVSL